MSKEKQIEDMAKVICGNNRDCKTCVHNSAIRECGCIFYANRLYKQGYRKQSEGEWKMQKYPVAQCSVCGFRRNVETQDAWKFCPNCGAKMKGV